MLLPKLSVLLLGSVALLAHADLPHTFSANTPARAAEVNENFSYLANEISQLKSAQSDNS